MTGPIDPDHPSVAYKRRGQRQFMHRCQCGHKHYCVLKVAPPARGRSWWQRRKQRTELLDAFLRGWDGDR
jgi:hypothetical protein